MATHRHQLTVFVVLLHCARLHSTFEHAFYTTLLERKAGLKFGSLEEKPTPTI